LKIGSKGWSSLALARPDSMKSATMRALADPTLDLASPLKGPFERLERPSDTLSDAAIQLAKKARLLPAVIAAECPLHIADQLAEKDSVFSLDAQDAFQADISENSDLRISARAKLPVRTAPNSQIVCFRSGRGNAEHVAILVGDPVPSKPVLTRLHSECLTGDVLGSLKCDCGEQLDGALKLMSDEGAGILLYLAQEGRGIGLVSKLKAYALQDQGFDTVDANTRLGFKVDERLFEPAAAMLKILGFHQIRLLTNNPNKVAALGRLGINVVERVKHQFPANPHNEHYMAIKKSRTGHMLD